MLLLKETTSLVHTVSLVKPRSVFQLWILFATMELLSQLQGEYGGPEVVRRMFCG